MRPGVEQTQFESAVVRYLHACGVETAERRRYRGEKDLGCILGLPGVIVECVASGLAENATDAQIDTWLEAVEVKVAAYGMDHGVLVVKRRGVSPLRPERSWAVVRTKLLCGEFTTRFYLKDWAVQYVNGCFACPAAEAGSDEMQVG